MATAKKTAPRAAAKTADAAAETAKTVNDAARGQFDTLLSAYNDQAEALRGQTEEFFTAVRGNFETAQSRAQALNADLVEAAREEVTDAMEFANELARAKTVADALEIQREYWTNLFESRVERTRELTNAAVEATREGFEPFAKSFRTPAFDKFFPFAAK